MRLITSIALFCAKQKFYVVDMHYGDVVSVHETQEEAERAATARPYSKVVQNPNLDRQHDEGVVRDH